MCFLNGLLYKTLLQQNILAYNAKTVYIKKGFVLDCD